MRNVLKIIYINCKRIYKFYFVIYQLNSTMFSRFFMARAANSSDLYYSVNKKRKCIITLLELTLKARFLPATLSARASGGLP